MNAGSRPPRYVPEEPFPPYSFVPRQFPHPTRDPAGHSFRRVAERPAAPNPERWNACRPYLYGIDLFNYGYYWEAHEVWESLWHACGRASVEADFLRSLIRLAAAGVKAREGRPQGTASHAAAARALLQRIQGQIGSGCQRYMGLSLSKLCDDAAAASEGRVVGHVIPGTGMIVMFSFVLHAA
jgi:uncharacterized protein